MIKHESRVNIWQVAAIIAVALFLFGLWTPIVRFGVDAYEDAVFALRPSAARASAYGNRHFSAKNSALYDIDKAEYFYQKAAALDPSYPYVNHQLARLEFLRSRFPQAMQYINKQIALNGDATPNSYYVRGLIEGFRGNYEDSAKDYERYLESDPHNWAAINDYSWVLLKAHRFAEAAEATDKGLVYFPENPWLLNSHAIALYELGRYGEALVEVQKAQDVVSVLSREQWLVAYPGNDPRIAELGVSAFKKAVEDNIHTIMIKVASGAVQ